MIDTKKYIKIISAQTAKDAESSGGSTIRNQTITITQNGVYTPSTGYTGIGKAIVNVDGNIESLSVTPTTSEQTFTPTGNTDGYGPVTVDAVTASIDANIAANNIKSGVSILGVTGNVVELKGETKDEVLTVKRGMTFTPSTGKNGITSISIVPNNKTNNGHAYYTITPTTSAQNITVPENYCGFADLRVEAVTSSIDANITANNIKKNVSILGVTGIYEDTKFGATANTFLGDVDANGVLQLPSAPTDLIFTGVKKIANISSDMGGFFRKFQFLPNIGIVSLPDLKDMPTSGYGFANAFRGSGITKLLCPKLEKAYKYDFQYTCYNCTNLNEINFDSLSTMYYENQCFYYAFYGCTSLQTARFRRVLYTQSSMGFSYAFANCTSLASLYFDSLLNIAPAYNTFFQNMLNGVTGCVVHFPSNLDPQTGSTTISGMIDYPNFGGTNTVLTFDLPPSYLMRIQNSQGTVLTGNYFRCSVNDTATALCWTAVINNVWTYIYTDVMSGPQVGDTVYSDPECTIPAGTVHSLT